MIVLQFGLFKDLKVTLLKLCFFPESGPSSSKVNLSFVIKNFFYFQEEIGEVSKAPLAESKPEKPKIGLKPKLEKPKSKIPRSVVAEPATVVDSDSSNNNGIKTRYI